MNREIKQKFYNWDIMVQRVSWHWNTNLAQYIKPLNDCKCYTFGCVFFFKLFFADYSASAIIQVHNICMNIDKEMRD